MSVGCLKKSVGCVKNKGWGSGHGAARELLGAGSKGGGGVMPHGVAIARLASALGRRPLVNTTISVLYTYCNCVAAKYDI